MSDRRPEQSIAFARAQVMIYDDVHKKWVHSGSSSGPSKVQIYHHFINTTFRVVGRKLDDHEVVINCGIRSSLKYNQATPTFHQWRDQQQVYGLNFSSREDADVFATAMMRALEILNSGGALTLRPAPPVPQQQSQPQQHQQQHQQQQQLQQQQQMQQQQQLQQQLHQLQHQQQGMGGQVPVYQQPHQHNGHYEEYHGQGTAMTSDMGYHPSGSDPGYDSQQHYMKQQQMIYQQQQQSSVDMERRLSLQQQSSQQSSLHHVQSSPVMSPQHPAIVASPTSNNGHQQHLAQHQANMNDQNQNYGNNGATNGPPMSKNGTLSAQNRTTSGSSIGSTSQVPAPAPPPPPPPPPPPTSSAAPGAPPAPPAPPQPPVPMMVGLAAQLQNAKLRKTNQGNRSTENSGGSTTSSSSSSGYGSIGRPRDERPSLGCMDELQKTLARRRAKKGDEEDNTNKFEKSGSSPPCTVSKGSGSESPKPGRRRFGSLADEIDVSRFNGAVENGGSSGQANNGSSIDMEALKQDILKEMRKEVAKMKEEIIEAIRSEFNRR